MLKNRILTTLIILPLFVWVVLAIPAQWLAVVLAVLAGLAAHEWARMSGLVSSLLHWLYAMVVTGSLLVFWFYRFDAQTLEQLLIVAAVWWACSMLWFFTPGFLSQNNPATVTIKLMMGLLVLVPAWYSLVYLHRSPGHGHYWVLYIFVLIWVADSGAYIAGKTWGKNKLAPRISPGKTMEGALGAIVLSLPCAIIGSYLLKVPEAEQMRFIILSVAVIPVSIVGDLLESLLKRQSGMKDSGSMLPGHGGLMDRIDSLTSAAPVFVAGLIWWVSK
jgi:phosphatidate cytidylyltransferase